MAVGRLNPVLTYWLKVWGSEGLRKIGLEYPSVTPIGKLLDSPGKGSNSANMCPRYEPNDIYRMVEKAMNDIGPGERNLLHARYREGASDRVIALFLGTRLGKIRWEMELAHRAISEPLRIRTYR